jgi:hypothetical protein
MTRAVRLKMRMDAIKMASITVIRLKAADAEAAPAKLADV